MGHVEAAGARLCALPVGMGVEHGVHERSYGTLVDLSALGEALGVLLRAHDQVEVCRGCQVLGGQPVNLLLLHAGYAGTQAVPLGAEIITFGPDAIVPSSPVTG